MSDPGTLIYLGGAIASYLLARSVLNLPDWQRQIAAVICAAFWGAIAALFIVFMLLDAVEYAHRQFRKIKPGRKS